MITDWIMVVITFVYVVATIFICIYNGKSAKASREQIAESQRQYETTKRLETMPFLQLEIPTEQEHPQFEIEFSLSTGDSEDCNYKIVKLKNLGNGPATNIVYSIDVGKNNVTDYPPINAIMQGDYYYFQFTIGIDDSAESIKHGKLTWTFNDLLGNSYEQVVHLVFEENDLVRFENESPEFLGIVQYAISKEAAQPNASQKNI